jgi:hypothetical protein
MLLHFSLQKQTCVNPIGVKNKLWSQGSSVIIMITLRAKRPKIRSSIISKFPAKCSDGLWNLHRPFFSVYGWLFMCDCLWVAVYVWLFMGGCLWVSVYVWLFMCGCLCVTVYGWLFMCDCLCVTVSPGVEGPGCEADHLPFVCCSCIPPLGPQRHTVYVA